VCEQRREQQRRYEHSSGDGFAHYSALSLSWIAK
jgi:hypothetical protein